METCGVEVEKFMTMQIWIRRGSNDKTRFGRVFLVEEDHETQATLQRLVPYHGGIQGQMRLIFPGAEVLETPQGVEVDFPVR